MTHPGWCLPSLAMPPGSRQPGSPAPKASTSPKHRKATMKALKFQALLKPTIWGGEEVTRIKRLTDAPQHVGESWEISGVPGNETPVAEGEEAGLTLPQLIERHGAALVGQKNLEHYGTTFPLLIKFISARQDLSIQVHPDDAMAQRMGHPYGKTEMWYIVGTAPGASLCSGFNADFSADGYTRSLADGTLMQHLSRHTTHPGDCFFIPAGRIHSIGAGNFLVEIQQSSNDTFRVYDFDRTDAQGHKRELHVEQAREALDYKAQPDYLTHYTPQRNACVKLVDCPQFTTRLIQLDAPLTSSYADIDSFVIVIAYKGAATLAYDEGELHLQAGESVLLPATNRSITFKPEAGGFEALETFCR